MKRWMIVGALFGTIGAYGSADAGDWATTRSGKQVVLHDDGSWTEINADNPKRRAKVMFPGLGHLHWAMTPEQIKSRYPLAVQLPSGALRAENVSVPAGKAPRRFWEITATFGFDAEGLTYVDLDFGAINVKESHRDLLAEEVQKVHITQPDRADLEAASSLEWSEPFQTTVAFLDPGQHMQVRLREIPKAPAAQVSLGAAPLLAYAKHLQRIYP